MSLLFPKFDDEAVPITKSQNKEAHKKDWKKWESHKWNSFLVFALLIVLIICQALIEQFIENYIGTSLSWWLTLLFYFGFASCVWIPFYFFHLYSFVPVYRL